MASQERDILVQHENIVAVAHAGVALPIPPGSGQACDLVEAAGDVSLEQDGILRSARVRQLS
jgi:hypothetical protein